jgi:hypothetical protein
MAVEKICIIAKTYPTLSRKYNELVCTAGIRADGSWIRLYPIPFRQLEYDKQYHKFQWIEVDIERNMDDFRPETYRLRKHDSISINSQIPPDKNGTWATRRDLLLRNVYTDKQKLIADAYNTSINRSLAVFKPAHIKKFVIEKAETRVWDPELLGTIEAKSHQVDLFLGAQNPYEVVHKVPYDFSYEFIDENGFSSKLQIIDWEIGMLYWNCLKSNNNNEQAACEDVQKMYWDNFVKTKDVYLILGTTKEFHAKRSPNPFLIIGVFPPKPEVQMRLL